MLKYLFYAVAISFGLGQFSSLTSFLRGPLYLFDLLLFVFTAYAFVFLLVQRRLWLNWFYISQFVFLLFALLSFIVTFNLYSLDQVLEAASYLLRYSMYIAFGIGLNSLLRYGYLAPKQLYFGITIFFLEVFVGGLLQLVFLPDFTVLDPSLGWDPHQMRFSSVFFDPNFTGIILNLCFVIFLFLQDISKPRKIILLSICLLGIFFTFSRSSWLMLGIFLFVMGMLRYRLLLVLSVVLAFFIYFAIPRVQTRLTGITDPSDSAHFRLISWRNTLDTIDDAPLFGHGFNFYRYVQKDYGYFSEFTDGGNSGAGSDSSILFAWATTGVFGVFAFVISYIYIVIAGLLEFMFGRKPAHLGTHAEHAYQHRTRLLNLYVASSTLGLVASAQFVNALFFPAIMFCYFILINLWDVSRARY